MSTQAAVAGVAEMSIDGAPSVAELKAAVTAAGKKVAALKAAGTKSGPEFDAALAELLAAKAAAPTVPKSSGGGHGKKKKKKGGGGGSKPKAPEASWEEKLAAATANLAAAQAEVGAAAATDDAKRQKKAAKGLKKAEKGLKLANKKPKGERFGKAKVKATLPKAASSAKAYVNTTPAGEKKDMSAPMASSYDPAAVESAWGEWWEASKFATPDVDAALAAPASERFVMVIPPPNVTGHLHLGHALTCAIEDSMARWNRMKGKHVLWLPGTDHAGIATQVVVAKKLLRETGQTRHDLGRDAFLKKIWEWKEQNGSHITKQLRRLGASVDWSREVFTMDERLSESVTEAFVRMYEKGIIYRDYRLVNWCCALNTCISDIEVEHLDVTKRCRLKVPGGATGKTYEFGCLTKFAYNVAPMEDGAPDAPGTPTEVVVATTRLETMLGDTAVAVHPNDPRYTSLHGRFVVHPFNGKKLPVIHDGELVDMAFGTGVVKITPAHDPNDYECGLRHGLEQISLLNDDGTMNANCGEFEGQFRYDCREALEAALEAKGLLRGKEDNAMSIGTCSRSKDIVEPRLKPQWFVNIDGMADRALDAVRSGELVIKPKFHEATWFRWLENKRPWCISRQLWWGHRIPAYLVSVAGEPAPNTSEPTNWVVARTEADAMAKAIEKFGKPASELTLSQDEDVLDTWFSSGIFPFSTMGWPKQTKDFEAFFPGAVLETGHDILFFWVRFVHVSSVLLSLSSSLLFPPFCFLPTGVEPRSFLLSLSLSLARSLILSLTPFRVLLCRSPAWS